MAWINLILAGVSFVSMFFLMQETRGSALLERRAKRLTQETGRLHVIALDAGPAPSILAEIKNSVSRPLVFLATEPIVAAFSLWSGLLWGILVSVTSEWLALKF